MGRSVLTISFGVVLLIAAVAGFVIVPEHALGFDPIQVPAPASRCPNGSPLTLGTPSGPTCTRYIATGLAQTTYDALKIATWAVLIVGVLFVIVGLISFARRSPRAV